MYLYHLARTPLGSALVATWQSDPRERTPPCRSWILWVSKDKAVRLVAVAEVLILRSRSPERSNRHSTISKGGCETPSFIAAIY